MRSIINAANSLKRGWVIWRSRIKNGLSADVSTRGDSDTERFASSFFVISNSALVGGIMLYIAPSVNIRDSDAVSGMKISLDVANRSLLVLVLVLLAVDSPAAPSAPSAPSSMRRVLNSARSSAPRFHKHSAKYAGSLDIKYPACARSRTDADGRLSADSATNGSGRVIYAAARFGISSCATYRAVLPYSKHENSLLYFFEYAGLVSASEFAMLVTMESNELLLAPVYSPDATNTAVETDCDGRTNGVNCILMSIMYSENDLCCRLTYFSHSSLSCCSCLSIIVTTASPA